METKIGQKYSHHFEVSQNIVDLFINLSKDKNLLHVNENYAINKGFISKVVHGNIQNCFLSYFVGEIFSLKEVLIISQTIKYKKPVYVGYILKLEAEIENYIESVSVYEIKFKFKYDNLCVSEGKLVLKNL